MEVSGARGEEITRNGRRSPIESPRERGTNRKLANVVMRGERLKKGRQGRLARGGGVRAATLAGWEDGSEGCGHGCGSARASALAVTVGVGYKRYPGRPGVLENTTTYSHIPSRLEPRVSPKEYCGTHTARELRTFRLHVITDQLLIIHKSKNSVYDRRQRSQKRLLK